MLIKNKKFITAFLILLVISIGIGTLWYFRNTQTSKKISETPPEMPEITGVETTNSTPEPISKKDELINVLIDFSPVNEKRFSFKFSFKENKFLVNLNPPGEESYQAFVKWLKDGGFEEIPMDEFIIENR